MPDFDVDKHWNEQAQKFIGRKIVRARYMTHHEASEQGWNYRPLVLILDDGTIIWPSRDDEGNEAGALFGVDSSGNASDFPVLRR